MVEGSTTGVGISSSILGEGYWILDGLRDGPDFESASGYRWTGVCGAACACSEQESSRMGCLANKKVRYDWMR